MTINYPNKPPSEQSNQAHQSTARRILGKLGIFNQGPPDLDEVWRDFNKKLNNLFKRGGNDGGGSNRSDLPGAPNAAGIGAAIVLGILVLLWGGSGFFIVQEGQAAVISQFGKYTSTTGAGFQWRIPYPIQSHEIVDVLRVRKVEVGTKVMPSQQRLKEALMLTDDENIVDIQFEVQYRIRANGAADFIFNNRKAEDSVKQLAEAAMREVVGRKTMDSVLYESRSEIANEVQKLIQRTIDNPEAAARLNYKTGIEVTAVAIQNAQPPEPVQAAFDDAVKAGQDKERAINEGQAYAKDVLPRAEGTAARLLQEAEAYRAQVSERAEGEAARFKLVLAEYNKAPGVTRERLYMDTMQRIFESTSKVMIDAKSGNNLLNLPLDKLMQQAAVDATRQPTVTATPPVAVTPPLPPSTDDRSRENLRSRDARP